MAIRDHDRLSLHIRTAAHVYTGNLLTLLNWYGLLGGLVTLSLFTLHGAIFLSLRTTGGLRGRAHQAAVRAAAAAVPLAAVFLVVTQLAHGRPATDVTAVLAAVALAGATAAITRGREGWAFAGTALTLVLAVATLFGDLWPNVLPSTTSPAFGLTVNNASSSHYTLMVMTWVALLFTPVVLAYQGWTHWVFRQRLSRPGCDDGELAAAAERARLLPWITSLPRGWDTPVGSHGAAMSGGERQRLALAMALLADLLAATTGRATLLITHDLDGQAGVDEIMVLGHRRVVERGTHACLLAAGGYYARMWAAAAAWEPAGAAARTVERTHL